MKVGAAITLNSGCLTVARFATSLDAGMNDLCQRYRAVGGDINGLAAQILATESALSELSAVLANPSSDLRRSPDVSPWHLVVHRRPSPVLSHSRGESCISGSAKWFSNTSALDADTDPAVPILYIPIQY